MNVDGDITSRFAGVAGVPAGELALDANLFEVYGLDSIGAMKLICEMEVEYDVDISEDEARSMCTLGDAIRMVKAKMGQAV